MVKTDFSLANSKFNDFLFEPIGDDARGITISMFSGLARLNLDPWREAARIATLPVDLARRAVAERIRQLDVSTWDVADDGRIAARFVKLLPMHERSTGTSNEASSFQTLVRFAPWLIFLAALGLMLAMSLGGRIEV